MSNTTPGIYILLPRATVRDNDVSIGACRGFPGRSRALGGGVSGLLLLVPALEIAAGREPE